MINLFHGDCLDEMKNIPAGAVDLVIADLPYGMTDAEWDEIIPMPELWIELNRVSKSNAAVLLFGYGKFSAKVLLSNEADYRYTMIWFKARASGGLTSKKQPMRIHEDILVFYKRCPSYNPQMRTGKPFIAYFNPEKQSSNFGYKNSKNFIKKTVNKGTRFPVSVVQFSNIPRSPQIFLHPTQKPVDLLEYLILTYSNKGDTILDPVMGSGSTGIAAKNLDRNFIGIEKTEKYFNLAKDRIDGHIIKDRDGKIVLSKQQKLFKMEGT